MVGCLSLYGQWSSGKKCTDLFPTFSILLSSRRQGRPDGEGHGCRQLNCKTLEIFVFSHRQCLDSFNCFVSKLVATPSCHLLKANKTNGRPAYPTTLPSCARNEDIWFAMSLKSCLRRLHLHLHLQMKPPSTGAQAHSALTKSAMSSHQLYSPSCFMLLWSLLSKVRPLRWKTCFSDASHLVV